MKKGTTYLALIIMLSLIIYLVLPDKNETVTENLEIDPNLDLFPRSTTSAIIHHEYYSLSYAEEFEQAEWVAYDLKANQVKGTNFKRPYFIYDKKVKSKSANYRNYKNSGYTKGHLCPAGDRRFNKDAFDETFYTSNISPQTLDFNAGIWNRLEQKVRYWTVKDKSLFVVTGGVLKKGLKSIGTENVAVPEQFYKILLDYSEPHIKAIAFLIPHKKSNRALYQFVVPIDKIEALTGIDFFPGLADDVEDALEASADYKDWSFK